MAWWMSLVSAAGNRGGGGGVGTIIGGYLQVKAAEWEAQVQSAINIYNAQVARNEAQATRIAGAYKQKLLRDRMRKDLAHNQTLVAGSGFTMAGTPMQAQLNLIDEYAADLAVLDYNTKIEARRKINEANLFEYQAQVAKEAGEWGKKQAIFQTVSKMTSF